MFYIGLLLGGILGGSLAIILHCMLIVSKDEKYI